VQLTRLPAAARERLSATMAERAVRRPGEVAPTTAGTLLEQSASVVFLRTSVFPLALMLLSPPAVQFVWVATVRYDGDVLRALSDDPARLWSRFPTPSAAGAALAGSFLLMQVAILVLFPGETFVAVPTPMGNRPRYKLNGLPCFFFTHASLLLAHAAGAWDYGAVYDSFGPMLAFLGQFALGATVVLYVKGLTYPTNSDSGATGCGFVWDMWHGTELHPEVLGVSLKQAINCRFAMMGWSVLIVAFAVKQRQLFGFVSNSTAVSLTLQLVYIYKFFLWEGGYFNSIDIIHDRFGFYIFWGCSAFLPSIYTLTSLYLVERPMQHPPAAAAATLICGLLAVWANYSADAQRQHVRAANGNTTVWGREPVIVPATYTTGDGKTRSSFLLASGWWGISRHFNYVLELTLALCWCIPSGSRSVLGYVYVIFLTVLLVDRAYRDELRCAEKYGDAYVEYCKLVPAKMVPYIY
jgi:7-dehydrocholesterol reductase